MDTSRRKFFSVALGTTAGILTLPKALAQICTGEATDSETMGPFFPNANTPIKSIREDGTPGLPLHLANDSDLTFVKGRQGKAEGQVVYVQGKVMDINCKPISNAQLVIWQASESGCYNHLGDDQNKSFPHPKTGKIVDRVLDDHFQYWGKANSISDGSYAFKTIIPGFYPADLNGGWFRPPHIHIMVSALGYSQLVTQMYFRGSEIKNNDFIQELNSKDLILQSASHTSSEREALIVDFIKDPKGVLKDGLVGEFNIILKR